MVCNFPERLEAGNRFRRYNNDKEEQRRELKRSGSPLLDAWESLSNESFDGWGVYSYYWKICQRIEGTSYDRTDVQRVIRALPAFQDSVDFFSKKAGLFISAMINLSSETGFEIDLRHYKVESDSWGKLHGVDFIGFMNCKTLTVVGELINSAGMCMEGGGLTIIGNSGDNIGEGMKGGMIKIQGNAGDSVGDNLNDGGIYVSGNVGNNLGHHMKKGIIIVGGGSGDATGWLMSGGAIHIYGHCKSAGMMRGGELHLQSCQKEIEILGSSEDFKGTIYIYEK